MMLAEWIYMSVAIFIAELSYLLGIILYAAPIPHPSVKSAARDFMEESGKLIAGLLIIDLFLYIVSLQLSYVESALSSYIQRADKTIAEMASLQTTTVSAVVIFGVAVFAAFLLIRLFRNFFIITPNDVQEAMRLAARVCSTLAKILSPICMLYGVVILVQVLFKAYCKLIFYHWTTLVGLGVLLYLIPFKIGRPAAKFLIGFGMISYLMIPLYDEVSKLFQAWIERTIRILLWFPIKIAVFDVIFPIFYFGLVAWLLGAVAGVSWSPIQYGMGLSWITPIRRFMRAGVGAMEKLGKSVSSFIGGRKDEGEGEEGEEKKGPPSEEGGGGEESGGTGGRRKPPEEGGGEYEGPQQPSEEGARGRRRLQTLGEEEIGEEIEKPSTRGRRGEIPPTEPPEEGLLPPSEEAPTIPRQEIGVEEGVAEARVEEFETEKVDGTSLKMVRGLPESVKEEAKKALEELPTWDRKAVNSITVGESSPIYGAGGQYLPSTKEAKVYREGIAYGETKEILQHEVGHGVFFNMPPEKQKEFFEALNEAGKAGYKFDQRIFLNPETAGHEAFAYTYTEYHKGKPIHESLERFMHSYYAEQTIREMEGAVGVEEGALGEGGATQGESAGGGE